MRDDINWIPFDYEEVAATSLLAVGLTANKITDMKGVPNLYMAKVKVQDFPVAWNENGITPTAATKNTTGVGAIFYLESLYAMDKFLGIGVGGTSNLAVTYYKAC